MSLSSFLYTVKWFQVLVYNGYNLKSVICLYTVYSIKPIDRTLSRATTPGQSGSGSNGNEGVLFIPQISKVGALQSDGLMSYLGHSLRGGYPSAEMQSAYSRAPGDWALSCSVFVTI